MTNKLGKAREALAEVLFNFRERVQQAPALVDVLDRYLDERDTASAAGGGEPTPEQADGVARQAASTLQDPRFRIPAPVQPAPAAEGGEPIKRFSQYSSESGGDVILPDIGGPWMLWVDHDGALRTAISRIRELEAERDEAQRDVRQLQSELSRRTDELGGEVVAAEASLAALRERVDKAISKITIAMVHVGNRVMHETHAVLADALALLTAPTQPTQDDDSPVPAPLKRRAGWWTHDDEAAIEVGHLYYFAPENRSPPPYKRQIFTKAIVDVAADGTLAGVELIDDMPPPPTAVPAPAPDMGKVEEALRQARRELTEWRRVARALRIHGLTICDLPTPPTGEKNDG